MRNVLIYICFFVALSAFSSCVEEEPVEAPLENGTASGVYDGPVVEVPCSIHVKPFGCAGTKVAVEDDPYKTNELKITDFWLLQFGQKTTAAEGSRPFLAAVWHSPSSEGWEESYVRMSEEHVDATKLVWIVANIGQTDRSGDTYFADYAGKTLADFYADGIPLPEKSQLFPLNGGQAYIQNPSEGLPVPMSGYSEFDIDDLRGINDEKGLVVMLKSIVAKLTINVSGVPNLSSIKLMRIPSKVSFAPEMVSRTGFRSLLYDCQVAASASTYTLYLPQNKPYNTDASLAQVGSTFATKTGNAPPKATYISLKVTQGGETLSLNIFPGVDKDDYDILANTHYTENVTATSDAYQNYLDDLKKDSRMMRMRVHDKQANCYILNPIFSGTTSENVYKTTNREEVYTLPFVQRVNEAYSGNTAKSIDADDEWLVHHLWQDEAQPLVYFTESSGLKAWKPDATATPEQAVEYFGYGNGDGNVYVAPVRSTSSSFTRGNVVLALRKKDPSGSYVAGNGEKYGEILWSWHLWVTDYEPDSASSYSSGYSQAVRGISGSRVFHYRFWGTTSASTFKWIMDRNLGAKGWNGAPIYNSGLALDYQTAINPVADGYGLFYQWGRKDPFPGESVAHNDYVSTLQLYDISGNAISARVSSESTSTAITPASMHQKPMVLQRNIGYGSMGKYWGDNDINDKSLYDPCPPGWVVPSYSAYSGFVKTLSGTAGSNMNLSYVERDDDSAADDFGYYYNKTESFAVDPSGGYGTTYPNYFPVAGFVTSAGRRDIGGICDIWALEQKSEAISTSPSSLAAYLYIGKPLTGRTNRRGVAIAYVCGFGDVTGDGKDDYYSKHHAFGVRCVKTSLSINL